MMMTTTRRSLRTSRNRCHEPCPEGSRTRRQHRPRRRARRRLRSQRREAHRTTRVVTKLSTPRPRRTRFCMRRGARSSRLAPSDGGRRAERARRRSAPGGGSGARAPRGAAKRAFAAGALKDDLATKSAWCVEPLRPTEEDVMKQRVPVRACANPSSDGRHAVHLYGDPDAFESLRLDAERDDGYGKAEAIPVRRRTQTKTANGG